MDLLDRLEKGFSSPEFAAGISKIRSPNWSMTPEMYMQQQRIDYAQKEADKEEAKKAEGANILREALAESGGVITPELIIELGAVSPELAKMAIDFARVQKGDGAPSNVREYEYFSALTPEEQNQYLTMKRSSQIMNLGGTQAVYNPLTQDKGSEFEVTPKPEQMPEFKGEQERAKAEGKYEGEAGQRESGQQQFRAALGEARSYLSQLAEKGNIASTQNTPYENLGLSISNSMAGRAVQDALGTERGALMGGLEDLKPRLVASIMQATGASARSLDSNTELKLALDSLGSGTLERRLNALDTIEQMYMTGKIDGKAENQGNQGGYTVGQVIEHGGKKYRVIGGDPSDPDVELVE